MTERWQHELSKLKDVWPPPGLWDRVTAAATDPHVSAGAAAVTARRRTRLWAAVGAAVAIALVAGMVGVVRSGLTGSGQAPAGAARHAGIFRDRQFGWTVRYPAGLIVRHITAEYRWPLDGIRITNFAPNLQNPTGSEPEMGWLRTFPVAGVAAQIWYLGGPAPVMSIRSAQFPLPARSFSTVRPYVGGAEPRPAYRAFDADGYGFVAAVWIGPDASPADQRAVWSVISSLRFPRLREGTIWHDSYVLGQATDYPVGSITAFPASSLPAGPQIRHAQGFFLIHAPRAFYVIEQHFGLPAPPYLTCQLSFSRPLAQFYCSGTNLRWNRSGQPLMAHAHSQDWQLQLRVATLATDGHVLFGPSFGWLSMRLSGNPWR